MNSFGSEQGQAAGCYFSGTILSSYTKFGELLDWLKTLLAYDYKFCSLKLVRKATF